MFCILMLIANYTFILDHAPCIFMDKNEVYYPSSTQYFLNNTHVEEINGVNWLESNIKPKYPSDILTYFYGECLPPTTYAIVLPERGELNPVVAIINPCFHNISVTYFNFYPYNRGKKFLGTIWDNHIGDIEYSHIRFSNCKAKDTTASFHSWNNTRKWEQVELYNNTNHFILYSARGSHGLWFNEGKHEYFSREIPLYDYTSKGVRWETWKNLIIITPYDWKDNKWLTDIWRWGDPYTLFNKNNCYFTFCRFGDGPVGMLGKSHIQYILQYLKESGYVCKGCLWDSGIF